MTQWHKYAGNTETGMFQTVTVMWSVEPCDKMFWDHLEPEILLSHRGSVSWLESAPNSSDAIASSGFDLFPYLRGIQ